MKPWVKLPPRPGERVLCAKTGAIPIGGLDLALIGGILVLTDQRLYHGPLKTRFFGAILSELVGTVLPPAGAGLDLLTRWANKARAVETRNIVTVEAVRGIRMRIGTQDGKRRDFLVAAGPLTPLWSRKNPPHRDEMCEATVRAVRAARAGPPPVP
jgi:hypothetical protein